MSKKQWYNAYVYYNYVHPEWVGFSSSFLFIPTIFISLCCLSMIPSVVASCRFNPAINMLVICLDELYAALHFELSRESEALETNRT